MDDVNTNAAASQPPQYIGVGDVYKSAWKVLWQMFPILVLIWLVGNLIGSVVGIMIEIIGQEGNFGEMIALEVVSAIYQLLVAAPLSFGIIYVYLRAVRGQEVKINHLFEVFNNYFNVVVAIILMGIFIGIGLIFLIIPGIIIALKLSFAPYLIVDQRMGFWDAFGESWRLTKGHAPNLFFIYLLGIPIAIAGLIVIGIGIIPATIWIGLAAATYYHAVNPAFMVDEYNQFQNEDFGTIN